MTDALEKAELTAGPWDGREVAVEGGEEVVVMDFCGSAVIYDLRCDGRFWWENQEEL